MPTASSLVLFWPDLVNIWQCKTWTTSAKKLTKEIVCKDLVKPGAQHALFNGLKSKVAQQTWCLNYLTQWGIKIPPATSMLSKLRKLSQCLAENTSLFNWSKSYIRPHICLLRPSAITDCLFIYWSDYNSVSATCDSSRFLWGSCVLFCNLPMLHRGQHSIWKWFTKWLTFYFVKWYKFSYPNPVYFIKDSSKIISSHEISAQLITTRSQHICLSVYSLACIFLSTQLTICNCNLWSGWVITESMSLYYQCLHLAPNRNFCCQCI